MSEPTCTRATLRRAIALAERMDFFRRYAAGTVAMTGSPTASTIPSASLTQADDYWNNAWIYIVDGTYAAQERRILDFAAATDLLTLEYPLAGAPSVGNTFEIHNGWPPVTIHQSINRAIERANRIFISTFTDTSLCLKENTLRYSLTGLANTVHRLQRVWVERVTNSVMGTIDSVTEDGANLQLEDADIFTTDDEYNTWKIAIYSGTGAGQIATIDDVVATGTYALVTTADFTAAPVAGDKYRIWNENNQQIDLYELNYRRTDAKDYPDTLYLENLLPEYYGCRLNLQYSGLPGALTTDASTTTVPEEYIILRARALLHEDAMGDNRADATRHSQLATFFHQQADDFMYRYAPTRPAEGQQYQSNSGITNEINDPLNWWNGRGS